MAQFVVRNSMNPHKAVMFGVTYKQVVDKSNKDGDLKWVLEVATGEPDATTSGTIPPYFVTLVDLEDIDLEIEKAVSVLSEKINWDPLLSDNRPPFVDSIYPDTYIAEMHNNVIVNIIDLHPSAGIDIDSIEMIVNGFDVTSDLRIRGDEFEYEVEWRPPSRVYVQIA